MSVDQKTRDALDHSQLRLPLAPKVSRVEVEEYTDSTGEPSLRVLVVLDEETDVEALTGDSIIALKNAIFESLQQHGVTLFPYIFLAKESELQEASSEK